MAILLNKKVFKVNKEDNNKRLDTYVSSLNLDLSRAMCQKMIKQGKIKVNEKVQKESYKIKEDDKVEVEFFEPEETNIVPEKIPLDIVYEDDDIIVINKQKGLVVHPGNGNPDGTLVNAILEHCKGNLSGVGGKLRPGIVHRLDKDTSGLMIVAKNDKAHINLSEQLKEHKVSKIYTTIVRGNISEDTATIDMPIARSKTDRKKMAVDKDGKEAITHIKVIERFGNYTLLRVKIDTGRTHQIRVHLAQIGHPVLGDEVYSNGKNEFGVKGQLLHSTELDFVHPITNKKMHFEAKLPDEFQRVIVTLENKKV